jgi:hypothetical protein
VQRRSEKSHTKANLIRIMIYFSTPTLNARREKYNPSPERKYCQPTLGYPIKLSFIIQGEKREREFMNTELTLQEFYTWKRKINAARKKTGKNKLHLKSRLEKQE